MSSSRGSCVSDVSLAPALSIRAQVAGDHARVEVAGEVDLASAGELEERLNALQPLDHGRTVVVDCSQVGFMDASGLSAFLRAQSFARHHDGDVVVARPEPERPARAGGHRAGPEADGRWWPT